MPPLIEDITRYSGVTLLSDTYEAGAQGLLKMLLCKSSRKSIHVLLYEYQGEDLLCDLPHDVQSRITIHDFVSDPLGWMGDSERCISCDILSYIQNNCTGNSNDDVLIAIDSLNNLILHRSLAYTCRVIHSATHKRKATDDMGIQMIVGVHRDLIDSSVLAQLEHISSAVLTLSPPVTAGFTVSCSIVCKKVTGKIVKSKEEYKLGEKFDLVEYQDLACVVKPTSVDSVVDPTANLTFKLSLCDSEKEARSQTQLPYIYDKLRQSEVLKKSVGEGKIFYQPDEADDFDEDDPDDDLDI